MAKHTDAMDAHAMEAVASGVSTRNYPRTLDPIPDAMGGQWILEDPVPLGEHQVGGDRDAAPLVSFGEQGEQHLHLAAVVLREDGDHASCNTVRRTLEGQQRITATFRGADGRNLHVRRRATRAEPPQPAIYDAPGIDPAPGATRETIV